MTDTTRDPVAERLERIERNLDGSVRTRTVADLLDLLAFARDVLELEEALRCQVAGGTMFADEIQTAARRHLGGDQT